jgi:hypothetical protein
MKKTALLLGLGLVTSFAASAHIGDWIPSTETLTGTAHGEENGRILYVCQVSAHGGVHPGKVVDGYCNIGYAGVEEVYSDFSVYNGTGRWASKHVLHSPHPVAGGYENGDVLRVCLAYAHDGTHPGKVVDGYCNIGYAGLEEIHSHFRVLAQFDYEDERDPMSDLRPTHPISDPFPPLPVREPCTHGPYCSN